MPVAESTPKSQSTYGRNHKFIDPTTLMSIRHLEWRANVVVEGFWSGLHRSPYHGFSVEFTEYRSYSPGDDLRYLDWKLLARSDRYHIKKYEDETNLRCMICLDRSKSMLFGQSGIIKEDYANTLAATLATFLEKQGDAVGVLSFDSQIQSYVPPRNRPGHLRQLIQAMEKPGQGASTTLEDPLTRMMSLMKKRGLIVFISDFLAPIESFGEQLATLRAYGHECQIFHILDPVERYFTFEGAIQFEDQETGQEMFIDPAKAKAPYLEALEKHLKQLETYAHQAGAGYHLLTTHTPLEKGLLDFLKFRSHQGKRVLRRHQPQVKGS